MKRLKKILLFVFAGTFVLAVILLVLPFVRKGSQSIEKPSEKPAALFPIQKSFNDDSCVACGMG